MFKKLILRVILALVLTAGSVVCSPVNPVYADSVDLYWIPVAGSGTGNWTDTAHWATIYTTGTASFVNGDATVEGGGCDWTAYDDCLIRVASTGTWYTIDSITDADTLELTGNFAEADTGAVAYVIADGGHAVPTSTNNVYFNIGSFTGAGQIVTVDAVALCLSMDWTGATNTPTLAGSFVISYYSSVTLISGMSITHTGAWSAEGSTSRTFTTAGLTFAPSLFYLSQGGGTFALSGNLNIGAGTFWDKSYGGSGSINGTTITCGLFKKAAGVTALTLGNATINCTSWDVSLITGSIPANAATINCSGNFSGGGLTYNIVNLTGATSTVTGNNTFNTLGFTRAGVQTITMTGYTQTVTNFTRDAGTSVKTIVNGSLVKAGGGYVSVDYYSISGNTATPVTNIWYAGTHSTDSGGNSGWNFYAPNAPTVTVQAPTSIHAEDVTGNGTITNLGAGNINSTDIGFDWDIDSGAPYTNSVTTAGSYPLGAFTKLIESLPANTTIYYRSKAQNSIGWGYSAETSFSTAPIGAPTGLAISDNGILTWVMGLYASGTTIVRGTGSYPASLTDGTVVYTGTDLTVTDVNYNPDTTTYYYSAWGYSGVYYSTDYATVSIGGGMTSAIILAILIFLGLCLTIGGYALHRGSLAFASMAAWGITAGYCYILATSDWDTYMLLFWVCIAMIITAGIEGAMLSRGREKAQEVKEYHEALEEYKPDDVIKSMDDRIEARRKRRQGMW